MPSILSNQPLPRAAYSRRPGPLSKYGTKVSVLPTIRRVPSEMRYDDFAVALKNTLRDFHRLDLLADSPLLRSRLLKADAGPGDLQNLLAETTERLFVGARDERLRRVLEITYFRSAPKQEAAAERLGLTFSTYRRYLAAAVDRLARWLWNRERVTPSTPKLSIVVLPFVNLSAQSEQDYLVDGITEYLTTDLSRIPHMVVISRDTAFAYKDRTRDPRDIGRELEVRYVMEGSVQVGEDRLRINARLIDVDSGTHVWRERFDRPRANLFDVQDEITTYLARSVDIELVAAESRRALREPDRQLSSVEMTLRARAIWNQPFSAERNREARQLFEAALLIDETNVAALLGVVDTHMREVTFYGSENMAEQISIADAAASRALALEPGSAAANYSRATVLCAMGAPDCARHKFDVAIALDGNLARAHAYRGLVEIFLGRAEATEKHVSRAMRLSPRDPMYAAWEVMIGMADLYLGRLDQSLTRLERAVGLNPNCGWAQVALAVALSLRGRDAPAARVCEEARRIAPAFTIAKYRKEAMSDNPIYLAQRERFCIALRKVGIPLE